MALDVAFDEFETGEQIVGERIKALHRHVEPVLAGAMARGFERGAAIADPVAREVQCPLGIRQRDIDDLEIRPIEPRLLLPDRLGHFRLRLEGDDAAGAPDGAQHPETVDSLVGADVERGRAFEIEPHEGFQLELLGMKPVAHAAGEEMRRVEKI